MDEPNEREQKEKNHENVLPRLNSINRGYRRWIV